MTLPQIFAGAACLLASVLAHASEFKTVGAATAVLYDAPSIKGGKLFIAPRGMPVEVVLTYGDWVKVRDVSGDLAWLEAKLLNARRAVVVRNANAKVRSAANDEATVLMTADKGVLLDLADTPAGGWLKVRHKDGISGFIRTTDVWGI